jgi:hypothetical protein
MSKNPKGTIALAFVFTFMLGLGAGYLLSDTLQVRSAGQPVTDAYEPYGMERLAPAPPSAETEPVAPETLALPRERQGEGDGTRRGDGAGMAGRVGPGTGEGYRTLADRPASAEPAEIIDAETESEVDGAVRTSPDEKAPEAATEWRYRSEEERMQVSADTVDAEQTERRRLWRSRTADESGTTAFSRFRQRLVRDLDLTEQEADSFFTILEAHRRQVREEVIIPQRELQQRQSELTGQLENDLETILSEDQMATWRERYAPRLERRPGDETDRRLRRPDADDREREPENGD